MRAIINKDDTKNLELVFDKIRTLSLIAKGLMDAPKPSTMLIVRSIIELDSTAFDLECLTRELYNSLSERINNTFAIPKEDNATE